MIKYFLDTEFIEDGKTIDLISIGLVCEDGRAFYKQNVECQFGRASDWVWRNVFPHLLHFDMRGSRSCKPDVELEATTCSTSATPCVDMLCPWAFREEIREEVQEFCDVKKYGKPEFWGYFADYDWVAFCQLFGTMVQLPKGFPMYCRDLKQWADQLGDIRIPKPEVEFHHALVDAEWVKEAWNFLNSQLKKKCL